MCMRGKLVMLLSIASSHPYWHAIDISDGLEDITTGG